jgi:hypothetical protein
LDSAWQLANIGAVNSLHGASSMGNLLDRIKRKLRNFGRADTVPPPRTQQPTAPRDPTHSAQRLRTELDSTRHPEDPPSSDAESPKPTPASAASRVRKAVLSKARRGMLAEGAGTIWGVAPVTSRGLFDGTAAEEAPPLLTGATLVVDEHRSVRAQPSGQPASVMEGSTLFGHAPVTPPALPPGPSLLDPAAASGAPDERTDRADRLF